MTESSTDHFAPTAIYRVGPDSLEAAVVEKEGCGRALLFRDEKDAEEYRLETGVYPAEEGFGPATFSVNTLRDVLELHGCTHVVMPKSLIGGEDGPDFYAAEDFMWLLEECMAA
jgi:hypothetical protein